MGLYQDPETCISPPTRVRCTYGCLHRRHISAGGVQQLIEDQVSGLVYFLECLGFMINKKKSI